ncbi:MAG: hypothetical protein PVI40_02330, partial [Chlamydiota bacterium]
YVTDLEGNKKEVTLLKILGNGGAKRIIEIQDDEALAIPNMDVDSIHGIVNGWKKMVEREIEISEDVLKLNLMAGSLKKVYLTINFSDSEEVAIPAYTTKTFQSLAKKGVFVIDRKQAAGTTWSGSMLDSVFTEQNQLDKRKLDAMLQPLLEDAAKLSLHDIPSVRDLLMGTDSLNLAVVEKTRAVGSRLEKDYTLRYFGFDFSSKYGFPRKRRYPSVEHIHKIFHELVHAFRAADSSKNSIPYDYWQSRYSIEYVENFLNNFSEVDQNREEVS